MQPITLTLYGDPIAKAAARHGYSPKRGHFTYRDDPTTVGYLAWRQIFRESGFEPFPPKTPLSLTLHVYIRRPKSLAKKVTRPVSRPDYDNYAKLIGDALEGFAFENDSTIVDAQIHKHFAIYPDQPRTELTIAPAA